MRDPDRKPSPRPAGARFMSFGLFGPMGAIGERMGQGHPLDGFDPEAFQNGAYGNAESAAPADGRRGDEPGDGRGEGGRRSRARP